jgi:hypothetical protein
MRQALWLELQTTQKSHILDAIGLPILAVTLSFSAMMGISVTWKTLVVVKLEGRHEQGAPKVLHSCAQQHLHALKVGIIVV